MYRQLDPAEIVETAAGLRERIQERFPGAGLAEVGAELLAICRESAALVEWLARPKRGARIAVGAALALLLAVLSGGLLTLEIDLGFTTLSDLFQGLEAAVNNVVFLAIAVFFLLTWETRYKRKRALGALHALRSMAHIIDMHQLTKDPARLAVPGTDTGASPERPLDAFETTRYLDYCSELLSVISKVAALYVQRFQDPVTLAAVDQVESLTSGLSRKVWQKIMILDRV
jgi:hypothetical protein